MIKFNYKEFLTSISLLHYGKVTDDTLKECHKYVILTPFLFMFILFIYYLWVNYTVEFSFTLEFLTLGFVNVQ